MLTPLRRIFKPWVLIPVVSAWSLFFIACMTAGRTLVAPPQIAGAKFVGSKQCAQCHDELVAKFGTATHAKLSANTGLPDGTGCEACHGPGSLHVNAGGGAGTIINPKKSPETCFQCHLDKRGQFSLPNSHPVMSGKISCGDCHDPHEGNAIKGTGADLETQIETCTRCHTAQKGPFVFEHGAMKEGCTICHNPTLVDGTSKQSVNMAWQIHSIHRGENLANPYVLGTTNYQEVRFPGDLRVCTTCHVGTSYQPDNIGAVASVRLRALCVLRPASGTKSFFSHGDAAVRHGRPC